VDYFGGVLPTPSVGVVPEDNEVDGRIDGRHDVAPVGQVTTKDVDAQVVFQMIEAQLQTTFPAAR